MAANMQQMAGAGQIMSQQHQMQMQQHARNNASQYGQTVHARLNKTPVPPADWHATVTMNDRVGRTLELFSNVTIAHLGIEPNHALDLSISFEINAFSNCTSKDHYLNVIKAKVLEFFKKRQENSSNLQNGLNASAQAQAQANLNMQQQMNRGFGPQQPFAGMNQAMQGQQMPNQQQMLQLQQHHHQQQMMGMANQAGRGMAGPAQQLAMGPGAPGQRPPNIVNDLSRLPPPDREKVNMFAAKLFSQASEATRNGYRVQARNKLTPQQFTEYVSNGRDPSMLVFQTQAFTMLAKSAQAARAQQAAAANMMPQQAAMMQQQNSQQRANNMMPSGQSVGHDFSQFAPSMESIKDQQMSGLIAQQAGQMVVPASGAARNPTPQPGNPSMVNQGQNQASRQGQQPGQQQQMKMNQASQQAQAAQMKQMHSQQGAGMDQNQGPAMNPAANRGPNVVNPMGASGGQHANMAFGSLSSLSQRFQRNTSLQNTVLAMANTMTPEQQHHLNQLTDDKIIDITRKWTVQQRQRQIGAAQLQQQNQLNPNLAGAAFQGTMQQQQQQQPNAAGQNGGPPQGQGAMQGTHPQMAGIMDNMDLPPQVRSAILSNLPPDIKKWRELKMWLGSANNISPQAKTALVQLQRSQFQHWWNNKNQNQFAQQQQQRLQQQQGQQQGQPQTLQQGQQPPQLAQQQQQQQGQRQQQQQGQMMAGGMNMAGMPPNMHNIPQNIMHVTQHEIAAVRAGQPQYATAPDEQIRMFILRVKRAQWQAQANRMRAQSAASQGLGPQNPMAGPGTAQTAQQQNPTPQQQEANRQQPQPSQQQGGTMPGGTAPTQAAATKQQPTPQQQPPKNLKRPSPDDDTAGDNATDSGNAAAAATMNSAGARPNNASGPKKGPPQLTAQQIASMTPEQKAKYEAYLRQQMASKDGGSAAPMPPTAEAINRLKAIGLEAARQLAQEPMADIPMSEQERQDTGAKLKRIVIDMGKVGRGLSRWFVITGDEGRASMFFKFRQRLLRQFTDGDAMTTLRSSFSMRSSDVEQARAMLESMVRDIQAATKGGFMRGQNSQGQPAQSAPQAPQGNNDQSSSSAAVAPLNAKNLEKNSQALNRQKSKSANQPPPAPTVAQAPGFPTNASSPHGNPSYMSKAKDMNLQIPPRKKQKVAQAPGQTPNTPSPRVSKTASPEVKRAPELAAKPLFLCKEAGCDLPFIGFPTEQALKQHVEEEHVKPREDPLKFFQESLALALGLEMDGTAKKPANEATPAMAQSGSKQGQEDAMKRSASAVSRVQSATGRGENGTPKTPVAEATTPGPMDPWATSTLDMQALLSNMGYEDGLPTITNECRLYQSRTPNDTPESSKDGGTSEPNSDISENATLEIDMNWQSLDTDMLLNVNNTSMDASGATLDPSVLVDPLAGPAPDWDDIQVDFNKPFQFDDSKYFFDTSS